MPDLRQLVTYVGHMPGICLEFETRCRMADICQACVNLKTFYEFVLRLAYTWHILSESLIHVPGICLAYTFRMQFNIKSFQLRSAAESQLGSLGCSGTRILDRKGV
jgi:hypothetical protein